MAALASGGACMSDVDRIFVIDRDSAWCSHVASVLDGPVDIDRFGDVGAFLTANGGDVGAWGGGLWSCRLLRNGA